ncbi:MAG: hypothetical protein ACREO8_01175 [Luteimonas sp.]
MSVVVFEAGFVRKGRKGRKEEQIKRFSFAPFAPFASFADIKPYSCARLNGTAA